MDTIRDLFHVLGNKHNLLTVGCGATRDVIQDCLEEKGLPEKAKKELNEAIENLKSIIKEALEADKIATEIQDRIKMLDPDTGKPK